MPIKGTYEILRFTWTFDLTEDSELSLNFAKVTGEMPLKPIEK